MKPESNQRSKPPSVAIDKLGANHREQKDRRSQGEDDVL
jgi:hypothetical protein